MNPETSPEEESLSLEIFKGDYKKFKRKVEEALELSEKGGPRVGTSSFMKSIFGKIEQKYYASLVGEVKAEVWRIKKRREREEEAKEAKREMDIESARREEQRELKRSGGVDPGEI